MEEKSFMIVGGVSIVCMVSINIPEEVLLDLHEDKDDFADYMKKMIALDLYKKSIKNFYVLSYLSYIY